MPIAGVYGQPVGVATEVAEEARDHCGAPRNLTGFMPSPRIVPSAGQPAPGPARAHPYPSVAMPTPPRRARCRRAPNRVSPQGRRCRSAPPPAARAVRIEERSRRSVRGTDDGRRSRTTPTSAASRARPAATIRQRCMPSRRDSDRAPGQAPVRAQIHPGDRAQAARRRGRRRCGGPVAPVRPASARWPGRALTALGGQQGAQDGRAERAADLAEARCCPAAAMPARWCGTEATAVAVIGVTTRPRPRPSSASRQAREPKEVSASSEVSGEQRGGGQQQPGGDQ